jgi:hypothetical protein
MTFNCCIHYTIRVDRPQSALWIGIHRNVAGAYNRLMKKLALALLLLLAPSLISAHTSGLSIEKVEEGYKFDIGYSQDFVAGDLIRFDLKLSKSDSTEVIPFTSAWVRIDKGNDTLFAGPIAYGEFGLPGFSVVFPAEGDYDLSIRFEKGTDKIAETTLPIPVKAGSAAPAKFSWRILISLALGLIGGFAAAKLFISKKHV